MASNRLAYQPLQRHRRRSNPTSPTSPSYPRRGQDRPTRHLDVISPSEGLSATTRSSESPSLDVNLPSPTFDIPAFSSPNGFDSARPLPSLTEPKRQLRSSEDHGRLRAGLADDLIRPATSDAAEIKGGFPIANRDQYNSNANYTALPLHLARHEEYKEGHYYDSQVRSAVTGSPNLPNSSTSPQTLERHSAEESNAARVNVQKKSRLNLLNPMSLLARRRSAQTQKLDNVNLSVSTMSVPALPDNFDPSIRGKMVHDFSAPRTRRLYSQDKGYTGEDHPHDGQQISNDKKSKFDGFGTKQRLTQGPSPAQIHSPVFREHFQDDRGALRPAQTGYLHNMTSAKDVNTDRLSASMPAFAKKLPAILPTDSNYLDPSTKIPSNMQVDRKFSNEHLPTQSPPREGTPSPPIDLPPASRLPKHMTSTSSRFSFQLGSQASSAQEKLLEEKHKQHAATKQFNDLTGDGEYDEGAYDDYNFDEDDGLEERIPGVNADLEDNQPDHQSVNHDTEDEIHSIQLLHLGQPPHMNNLPSQSLQGFHFTPQSMTFSPTSTHHASQPTPRDDEGFAIGIADSREYSQFGAEDELQTDVRPGDMSLLDGLGIITSQLPTKPATKLSRTNDGVFDDELYFDDGEFDNEFADDEENTFDEDIFDDDTGRFRDIPAENAQRLEAVREAAGRNGKMEIADQLLNSTTRGSKPGSGLGSLHVRQPSNSSTASANGNVAGLTEGNLAAYHDALAFAANEAAAMGKFDRNVSFNQDSDDASQSQYASSQIGLISDESRFSNNFDSSAIAEDDGFPFEDDIDDELMIAEANAEALENDDEGFYGQEFGFFARAHGKGNMEMVNGGFFSHRGSNGVKRSHSGKANFQEPSLTPITERSEWSTRNSVASLQIPNLPASVQSIPSPGIAQLLELDSPGFEDDISFSALMKLRRGTFGGSSTSINSIGTSHAANSPLGHTPTHTFPMQDYSHGRVASVTHSLSASAGIPESEEEDDDDSFDKPTITQNTPHKKPSELSILTQIDRSTASPTWEGGERRRGTHSRTSSGAESVSYARDAEGRWVLERRRTGEDGGQEIVDREYLTGVRI